jgi:hypothetical protein
MPAHSAQHTAARLASSFEAFVARAEQDIIAELAHPRVTSLAINDDRKARWAAAERLVAAGRLVVVTPPHEALTMRPPPLGGERRYRCEMRVRLPYLDGEEERI